VSGAKSALPSKAISSVGCFATRMRGGATPRAAGAPVSGSTRAAIAFGGFAFAVQGPSGPGALYQ